LQAQGDGQVKLIDQGGFSLERLDVPAGESLAWQAGASGEHMLYVASGSGELVSGSERHPLGEESVAWLEAGERCELVAGDEGLAVLASSASAA
jgi:quercetin dioxygenase-like cupin family protein